MTITAQLNIDSMSYSTKLDSLPVPRTAAYPELKSYDFSIGKALKNNSALLVVTHTTNS